MKGKGICRGISPLLSKGKRGNTMRREEAPGTKRGDDPCGKSKGGENPKKTARYLRERDEKLCVNRPHVRKGKEKNIFIFDVRKPVRGGKKRRGRLERRGGKNVHIF